MKKIGLTYSELTAALTKNGWYFQESDQSWRAPGEEPCASIEALRDMCEIYPSLTRKVLEILLAGHRFDVKIEMKGYVTTITLQPQPVLLSDNPPVFARPVMM